MTGAVGGALLTSMAQVHSTVPPSGDVLSPVRTVSATATCVADHATEKLVSGSASGVIGIESTVVDIAFVEFSVSVTTVPTSTGETVVSGSCDAEQVGGL